MRQRRCLSVQDGQRQRIAAVLVFGKLGSFFRGRNLNLAAVQRTGSVLAKRHQNRRRQQVVVFRRLGFGQPVRSSLQLRKAFNLAVAILFPHQLTLAVGLAFKRAKTGVSDRIPVVVVLHLLQRKLNVLQKRFTVFRIRFGDVQRKLRVLLRVGDGHGLLCIVT